MTVRIAPTTNLCASPSFCQREMPTAMMMRKKANPRSNHETSMIEWLTGSAFWMITSIRLFSSIEESTDSGVRYGLEYINGAAVLNDPPTLHHDYPVACAARLG